MEAAVTIRLAGPIKRADGWHAAGDLVEVPAGEAAALAAAGLVADDAAPEEAVTVTLSLDGKDLADQLAQAEAAIAALNDSLAAANAEIARLTTPDPGADDKAGAAPTRAAKPGKKAGAPGA